MGLLFCLPLAAESVSGGNLFQEEQMVVLQLCKNQESSLKVFLSRSSFSYLFPCCFNGFLYRTPSFTHCQTCLLAEGTGNILQ